MEPLRFQYTLLERDYVKAMRFRIFKNRVLWIMFVAYFFMGIGLKLISPDLRGISIVWLFLIAALLSILYVYFIRPLRAVWRLRKDASSRTKITWSMNDEHIVITTKYGESKITWEVFQGVEDAKDHYLMCLIGSGRKYQIIPKRAFESPEQENAFRELVVEKGLTIN